MYKACIQRVLVNGSEMEVKDMKRLEMEENTMLRWCGVTLKDKILSVDLIDTLKDRIRSVEVIDRLGAMYVEEVMGPGRPRWYGLTDQKDKRNWVAACRVIEVEETKDNSFYPYPLSPQPLIPPTSTLTHSFHLFLSLP